MFYSFNAVECLQNKQVHLRNIPLSPPSLASGLASRVTETPENVKMFIIYERNLRAGFFLCQHFVTVRSPPWESLQFCT